MNDQKSHSQADIWDFSKALNRYAPSKNAPNKIARDQQTIRLFESIKARILALVADYKCIVDATKTYPGITKQITICTDKLGTLTRASFCEWRSKPNRAFQNMSPQEFFSSKKLGALEDALGLRIEAPRPLEKN